MLYLGTDRTWDQPHHQIYASSEYESNLEDITKHRITWEDPSVYVQNACVTDPSLAPEGCSTLYVLVPVPNVHDSINWNEIRTTLGRSSWIKWRRWAMKMRGITL